MWSDDIREWTGCGTIGMAKRLRIEVCGEDWCTTFDYEDVTLID